MSHDLLRGGSYRHGLPRGRVCAFKLCCIEGLVVDRANVIAGRMNGSTGVTDNVLNAETLKSVHSLSQDRARLERQINPKLKTVHDGRHTHATPP